MAPLLIGAISLASKYLPSLISKITGDDEKVEVANKVLDVGSELLGRQLSSDKDLDELSGILQSDPSAVLEFRSHLMDKVESILSLEVQDTQHARNAAHEDAATNKLMVRMAWLIMIISYLVIGGLIYAGYYVMANLKQFSQSDSALLMALISAALTQMYTERNQIMGYIYGNKVSNKVSEVMNSLSNKSKKSK